MSRPFSFGTRSPISTSIWLKLCILQAWGIAVVFALCLEYVSTYLNETPSESNLYSITTRVYRLIESLREFAMIQFSISLNVNRLEGPVAALATAASLLNFVGVIGVFFSAVNLLKKPRNEPARKWDIFLIIFFPFLSLILALLAVVMVHADIQIYDSVKHELYRPFIPWDTAILTTIIILIYTINGFIQRKANGISDEEARHYTSLLSTADVPLLLLTTIFFAANVTLSLDNSFLTGISIGGLVLYVFSYFGACLGFCLRLVASDRLLFRYQTVVLILTGAVLNGIFGLLPALINFPLYVDLVGSIAIGVYCSNRYRSPDYGTTVGCLAALTGSFLLGAIIAVQTIAYVGTAIVITYIAIRLYNSDDRSIFHSYGRAIIQTFCIGFFVLGPISTFISLPVTYAVWGSITFGASDRIAAWASAHDIFGALGEVGVIGATFLCDSLDKAIMSCIVLPVVPVLNFLPPLLRRAVGWLALLKRSLTR